MARTGVRASAIITKKNKILLIHRKKNGEEYWVFPGGGVEDNETAQEAVIREVKEETNLNVTKCSLAFMSLNELDNKGHPFFICEVADGKLEIIGEEKDRNSTENWYQLEWVDIKKLSDKWLVPIKAKEEIIKRFS